jgi:DNA-binding MarR family transcriptional regulator
MADQRPIGYWLKLVDRMIDEQFASTLEEHGVTRRQWQLMNVLSRQPSTVSQLDAAVAPFLSPSDGESSVEHLSELIDSAWVDSTTVGYELTERGRGAFDRLAAVVTEQRTVMSSGVTEAEYVLTIGVLERLARNMGWTDPAGG